MSEANPAPTSASPNPAQLKQASDALLYRMNQMSAAAQTGQLKIDPDEARALQTALETMLDQTEQWIKDGSGLRGPLPLGSQWLSEAMAQKFAGRVDGNDIALLTVLDQYRQALGQAKDAMKDSISHYTGTEDANHDALRKVQQ